MTTREIILNTDPKKRTQFLEDNADVIEEKNFHKVLTDDEEHDFAVQLKELSIKLAKAEQKKKDFLEQHNLETKPLKQEHKQVVEVLTVNSIEVQEQTYGFKDYDEGTMTFYAVDGSIVEQRRLKPSERQTSILSINKTA